MSSTATSAPIAYQDQKRWAWWWSVLVPATVLFGPAIWLATGQAWVLWAPVVFTYGVMPLLDAWMGEDQSNPPEEAVPRLEADLYYRRVTYALVPVLWLSFVFIAWFVSRHELPWHGLLATVLVGGAVGGYGINLGHEMGHKHTVLERQLAKLALALTGYGHFNIEHNRGHHRDVATPVDPASSRMGEHIYAFMCREIPGAARRAWVLERARLKGLGKPTWSSGNEILQAGTITVALWSTLAGWLGPAVLPFLLAVSFWSWFQLTSANYIEHYGLLRQKDERGRYEVCQPHHSWNSNHLFSNWALFHLQRHSDHHAHPLRRYQSLRHFEGLPSLPNGYFGMFVVAYVPAWWFKVMDPRLVAAVKRDPRRINFDPRQRERLMCQHELA